MSEAIGTNLTAARTPVHGPCVLFAFLWCTLCIAVPLWLTPVSSTSLPQLTTVLSYLVVVYAGTRVSRTISLGRPEWLSFMFWSFTYIWIGLSLYTQNITGTNPYDVAFSSDSRQAACAIALVGMLCFDLGGAWQRWTPAAGVRPPRLIQPRRVAVLAALTIVGAPFLVYQMGGFTSLFVSRADRSQSIQEAGFGMTSGAIAISLTAMVPVVTSACFITMFRNDPELRRRPTWLVSGVACTLLAILIMNPISNPRYLAGAIVLGLLFSLARTNRTRVFQATASIVFTALLFLFPYSDLYRTRNGTLTYRPLLDLFTSKGDYDTAVQMVSVIDFRHATGGTHGNQFLGLVGFFVPRDYWPSKPGSTGALLAAWKHYRYTNTSSPLWVEAYIDGGILAIILVFIVLGFVAAATSQAYFVQQHLNSFTRVLVPLVAGYSPIILRGTLTTAVGSFCVMFATAWFATNRKQDHSSHKHESPPSPP